MTHMKAKLLAAGLAVAVAVGVLAVSGAREGWVYSLEVDQFVTKTTSLDRRVRLQGTVGDENLEVNPGLMTARFELLGVTERVPVEFKGVVPDLFRSQHEVVVEGRLGDDGVFHADTLLTKCASKYEVDEDHPPIDDDPDATGEAAG